MKKKKFKKKLILNKEIISKLESNNIKAGEAGFTGGCTDGCTGTTVVLCTAWNCTEADCTADCGTNACNTKEFCTM